MNVTYSQFLSLVYHDLFDYPLLPNELEFWKVGHQDSPYYEVSTDGSFSFLPGRHEIVYKRIAAHKESQKKYKIAKKAARILSFIPMIQMISISGSLSMGNSNGNSSINLFIVTSPKTLWITRPISLLLLFLGLGKKSKVLANRWVDLDSLSFAGSCEIFTAHEILQIKVLQDKGGVYRRFIGGNLWAKQFFPNAYKKCLQYSRKYTNFKPSFTNKVIEMSCCLVSCFFEKPAKMLQLTVSKKLKTETHSNGKLLVGQKYWQERVPKLYLSRLECLITCKHQTAGLRQFID